MLLVLLVVPFTCGDTVTGGVKPAIDRAFAAADTRGASSSAREPHVQQLGGGVLRCLRQEDQPQLLLLPNLRRHWAERSMSQCDGARARAQGCFARCTWARKTTAKEFAPRLDDASRDASRSIRFHVATHPDAKRARLPPSSLAARVLLRTLRAPQFAVGRQHQKTTKSSS